MNARTVAFFNALKDVDAAVAQMLDQDAALSALLSELRQTFDFAAVQLIDPAAGMIEGAQGRGIARQWAGLARHPLEAEQRDIQSDIVRTLRIEEISGWDDRFDRWIYKQFEHDRLIRVFAPLFLIRDSGAMPAAVPATLYSWPDEADHGSSKANRHRIQPGPLLTADDPRIVRIGTVEAGHLRIDVARYGVDTLQRFYHTVSRHALAIYQTQMGFVLDVILAKAVALSNADSGSIHFLYDDKEARYLYEVIAGRISDRFPTVYPPRQYRPYRDIMQARTPQWIDNGLDQLNQDLYHLQSLKSQHPGHTHVRAGIRALACFPLVGGNHERGLLQLHFWRERAFTNEQKKWGNLFAGRAVAALDSAVVNQRRRHTSRAITNLHAISQLLVSRQQTEIRDLLKQIANNALALLRADVVTVYEYDHATAAFRNLPPVIAGKLNHDPSMRGEVGPADVPSRIIREKKGDNHYAPDALSDPMMRSPERARGVKERFLLREGIVSSTALPLKAGNEIVGMMFVNYRTRHDFTNEEELRLLNMFASTAAIAIRNQRTLDWQEQADELARLWRACSALSSSPDVKGVLLNVVRRSREMLGAKAAVIFPYEQTSDTFILDWVTYDSLASLANIEPESPRVDGITQSVIRSPHGYVVVEDCANPGVDLDLSAATSFFREQGIGSFIGVQLADRGVAGGGNGSAHGETMGVLYLDYGDRRVFTEREIRLAQMFGGFAALAIRNAREHARRMAKRLKVFLCYSKKVDTDAQRVKTLYQTLQRDGYDPWRDEENILVGEFWETKIRQAVSTSDVFIACLSTQAINATGYIHHETRLALLEANKKPHGTIFVIPARLDPCDVPDAFGHIQWVDLFTPEGYDKLKIALQVCADKLSFDSVVTRPSN